MAIMKKAQKEDAVSPVIGVMLMLVVTIIIAAVVTAFSSGLVTDIEKAPNAVLDVDLTSGFNLAGTGFGSPVISIHYLAGDSNLDTGKMTIGSHWIGTDGKPYSYLYDGSRVSSSPLVYFDGKNWGSGPTDSFGKHVFLPGESMRSYSWSTVGSLADDSGFSEIFGSNAGTITKGTVITLTINYGTVSIFNKEVTVE